MMQERFTTTTVDHLHRWTSGLSSLRFGSQYQPDFIAGQYIRVGLEVDGVPIIRPYSIVNAPGEQGIEIYVVAASDDQYQGALSSRLLALDVGSDILVNMDQMYGYLTLDEVPDAKNLWLLASGVGLAPFMSMLRHGRVFQRFSAVYLVHSTRWLAELGYAQELMQLAEMHSHFRYIPFVTRESADNVAHGRITDAIENGQLESLAGCAIDIHSQCMMCGNPALINDCTSLLRARGLERNRRRRVGNITVEKFW